MKPKPGVKKLSSLPKRKADFIEPMDCAPVSKLPDGSNWVFEIKLDGYRAVAVKSDRGVNLFSRRHKSFNHQYPHLVRPRSMNFREAINPVIAYHTKPHETDIDSPAEEA